MWWGAGWDVSGGVVVGGKERGMGLGCACVRACVSERGGMGVGWEVGREGGWVG